MRYDFSDNQEEILQGLTCPVLIIHGKKDDRVPVGDSQKAITFLSGESRLVILDGATHFFRTNNKTIIAVTKNWFEKYLRAG